MTEPLAAWLATATYARACGAADPAEVARQAAEWWEQKWNEPHGNIQAEAYVELLHHIERLST